MSHLRRLLPPAALFAILFALGLGRPGISARLGIAEPSENAGNGVHFALCFSLAWLLSRISGLLLANLRPRSRPIPKLVKDLVSGLLFLIAIVSGVILMLGHGAGGALAGSGVVLALIGFATAMSLRIPCQGSRLDWRGRSASAIGSMSRAWGAAA